MARTIFSAEGGASLAEVPIIVVVEYVTTIVNDNDRIALGQGSYFKV